MLAKKPKGATEKRRKTSSVSGFLWMLLGAILTLMIGVFLYLSPIFNFSPAGEGEATSGEREVRPKVETDKDNGDYEFYDVLPNQEMATIPDESISIEDGNTSVPSTFEPDVVVTQPIPQPRPDSGAGATDGQSTPADDGTEIAIIEEDETYDGSPVATPAPSNNSEAGTAKVEETAAAATKTYILQINSFGSADEADRRRAQVLMAGVDASVVKKNMANGQPLYQVISRSMNNRQQVVSAQQKLQNNGIDSLIVEQRR